MRHWNKFDLNFYNCIGYGSFLASRGCACTHVRPVRLSGRLIWCGRPYLTGLGEGTEFFKKNMPPKKKYVPLDFTPGRTFAGQSFVPGASSASGASSIAQSPADSSASSAAPSPVPSSLNLQALADAIQNVMSSSPVSESFEAIAKASSPIDLKNAVQAITHQVTEPQQISSFQLVQGIEALLKIKKNNFAREGALQVVTSVTNALKDIPTSPAYTLRFLPIALTALVDKDGAVKRNALDAIQAIERSITPQVVASGFISTVWDVLADQSAKPATKIGALQCVDFVCDTCAPDWVELQFYRGIPLLTAQLHDFKPEVAKQARKTMTKFMEKLDNQDVVPRIDVIIDAIADPKKVQHCIKTLSAVTFVAEVTEPCLAVLVPILVRALTVFSSQDSLRQSVVVTENLTRLVHNPWEVHNFIPELKPGIKQTLEQASLPEVRELASRAYQVLESAEKDTQSDDRALRISREQAEASVPSANVTPEVKALVVELVLLTVNTREFSLLQETYEHLCNLSKEQAHEKTLHFEQMFADSRVEEEDIDGVEVVNARFSLAYGGRMLLNKATMRLFKGHRYGLCGRNGCGKSTLMRAIANGKLEGFPDKSEVRTCFVEHRLQAADADSDLVSFIALDPEITSNKDEIAAALAEVGFDDERRSQSVGSLSGGWKMKLELARAMLMKADVLLLDEPTNHLDVGNVKWLEEYLNTHTEITSLIVSHDSGFLDAVCTDIIHYESKRLVYYKGNLSEFVKVRPEGKAYYTLSDSVVQMAFPPPGILTGVRSNTRAIARLSDVSFKYPGADKYQLEHVSCSVALSSRIAVLGPNGAGKSTLIKVLTGELIPTSGKVEKHPNLRIGYIAQHAFQHVEKHKEKTANQYLQWRYQNGDDREVHMKQTRIMSDEEKAVMLKPQVVDNSGRERILEAIIGRQKLKKSFQYEIQWKGMLPKFNTMMPREEVIERGFGKLVQEFDDHEASREGLGYRELTPPVIRKHFEDVGLDGDIADHTPMGSLSGGQLVKVVIAGATWNNPHLLVLDEPTNYLDRDSLGGLAVAIRDWSGGVILISHNTEFVGALSAEQWIVDNGHLTQKGRVEGNASSFDDASSTSTSAASSAAPSVTSSRANSPAPSATDKDNDSPANIKIRKKKKKLTRNEQKERDSRRRLRYLDWLNSPKGTPKPEDTDDEA